jgi:hypothetical protein
MVEDPAAAADVGWVLYVNMAWMVQLQQQQLSRARAGTNSSSSSSNSSSSSRGQQQHRVRPWHVQFLAAVGVPAWRAGWRPVMNVEQLMLRQLHTIQLKGQMLQMTETLFGFSTAGGGQGSSSTGAAGSQDNSSSSSSSSGSGDRKSRSGLPCEAEQQQESRPMTQQRSFEGLVPPRETLLLLLEVMLLHPGVTTTMLCYPSMQNLWSRMQPDSAEARETADAMLQPVLHLLGPAVLQQLEAASSSSSSSSGNDATLGDDAQKFAKWFAKITEWLVASGTTRCVV